MRTKAEQIWHKLFIVAAVIGIGGWFFVFLFGALFALMPSNLPNVRQPLPILNPYHRIAVGEPILVKFDVVKNFNREVINSSRYITCDRGNLVTLTSSPKTLPVGTYTLISDNIELPAKVSVGSVCKLHFDIHYHINPLKDATLKLETDSFVVSK